MFLSKNLRYLRRQKNFTQEMLCEKLGVKRTMISAYEDGRSEPKLMALQTLAETFGVSVDELLNRNLEQDGRVGASKRNVNILTIAVDAANNEHISLVGQKASAGYLNGYADPEYMENLPQFHLPNLSRSKTYRAFEINGDSMLPLVSGTIIIGEYVEQLNDIKSGKTYILVTDSEGIVYKRVFNYIEEKGSLYLVSDNEQYKPYEMPAKEVFEIWESKAFISTDFPNPKDKDNPVSLEDISKMITELRKEIVRMK
ncbi:XRE family transcriptional regulator [Anditalea andensis]|uniref:Transcriptional regulator n=1 Tax=Anditalea andensis TaxID=1048983 RepID=A0A074L448_9BACT|nr:LexA family transcriptional regulator [Anditalea andensis]KEO74593.1 transcriptional regulator [Anditalea andensis]